MKTSIYVLMILGSCLLFPITTMADGPEQQQKKATTEANLKATYEIDGHYWTVLVVATLLRIQHAKDIAYNAEYPDNVINSDGYCVRHRYTFLYPRAQKKVHAFTGGNPEIERSISMRMFDNAITPKEIGIAAHRLGDSYSHTNDKTGRMYPHLIAHLFQWKKPDKIKNNPDKYLQYVFQLIEGMGGKGTEVDMTVFRYIADAGLSSEENAAILKAEYYFLLRASEFNTESNEIQIVENYLKARLANEILTYITIINEDRKGKISMTVFLTSIDKATQFKLSGGEKVSVRDIQNPKK